MGVNPTEEVKEEKVEADNGFETHTLESDMKSIGIEPEEQESIDEPKSNQKEEAKKEVEKPHRKNRAQRKIEQQNRKIKELEQKLSTKEPEPQQEEKVIDIDDYENYDDYLEAIENAEKPKQESKPEEKSDAPDERINDMFEDGAEEYEDFDKLVRSEDLILSENLLNEVLESDDPAALAYYLASNKDKSKELSNMTPRQIQKALLRIELEQEKKPAKKVKTSNAPEPITPVNGESPKAKSLNDNDLSFLEHEALLNSKQANAPGGFI